MGLISTIKKPAVRVPLILCLMAVAGVWAARSCRRNRRIVQLLNARHLSFIRLLARTAAEQEVRPVSLVEIVEVPAGGESSPVEKVFLRDYAERPEFAELAGPGVKPLERLGPIEVVHSTAGPDPGEIIWSGYLFRLYSDPENAKNLVIFCWPVEPGRAQLAMAYISSFPDFLYYTSHPRYAGPGKGPVPADLGESPFAEGGVDLLGADSDRSPQEFLKMLEAGQGKLWARQPLPAE